MAVYIFTMGTISAGHADALQDDAGQRLYPGTLDTLLIKDAICHCPYNIGPQNSQHGLGIRMPYQERASWKGNLVLKGYSLVFHGYVKNGLYADWRMIFAPDGAEAECAAQVMMAVGPWFSLEQFRHAMRLSSRNARTCEML